MVSIIIDPAKIRDQVKARFANSWKPLVHAVRVPEPEPEETPTFEPIEPVNQTIEPVRPFPAQSQPTSFTDFAAKHGEELRRCREFYNLENTPLPNEVQTYEGWGMVGRQVRRGSKGYHHSRQFCLDLIALNILPPGQADFLRFKSQQYPTVAMFHVSVTEAKSAEPKPRRSRRR